MDYLKIFLYFSIYSFLGWVTETIYCSLIEGRFVYRGFLNGPVCPIYGFGALAVYGVLGGLRDDILLLFFASVFLTSALEYATSFILEKIFDMSWWDYSQKFMNLNGRICLLNSSLFGLLSLVFIEFIHPLTVVFVEGFSRLTVELGSLVLFIVFALDTMVTVAELLNLKPQLQEVSQKLREKEESLRARSLDYQSRFNLKEPKIRARLQDQFRTFEFELQESINDRLEDIKVGFSTRRILKSYPNISFNRHPETLENMRESLRRRRNKEKR